MCSYINCVSLTHCYTSAGTQAESLRTLTPHRKTHPLRCTVAVPPPSLALPLRPPSLLLLRCLFRGMWLAGCVRWPDSKSLTHSLCKFPVFYLAPHTSSSFTRPMHTLPDLTANAGGISPFSVSSQPSPCSDLFRCFVASRVCVRLRPCPVKYRLFKEVSNIIWPLYCNYKVPLLEIAHRERCPQALAESVSKS